MMDRTALIVQMIALGVCLWGESLVPLFMERKERLRHGARNVAIGLINGVVLTLGFSGLVVSVARMGALHPFGLIPQLHLAPEGQLLVGFIAFDLWMYGWHRANHRLPILWRFHRVHHADSAVDCTSAFRFHVGEMALSSILRLAVIPLLGIRLEHLVLYEIVLEPVILFHHSNIALPEMWDRTLRLLVVSPNMHRVHHSDLPEEANSNYASIFSFWDRLWGTYRQKESHSIRYGLAEFRKDRWHTLGGILTIPLA